MILPRATRRALDGNGLEAEFDLSVEAGLLVFQGHFPGDPVLPGIAQVDWAARFGAEAFGPLGPFQAVTDLKFMDIIRPGETVRLRLALDPARTTLRFAYQLGDVRKSSGTLKFAAEGNR